MIALVVCEGSTGQSLNVGVSEVSFANQSGIFELSMLSPHQASLTRKLMGRSTDEIAVSSLPEIGTYTIVVDPGPTPVGLTLTLSEPVGGVLTVDGPPVPINLDLPGQRGRLTFIGRVGQRVDLGVSNLTFGPGLGAVRVTILSPDGMTLASTTTSSDAAVHPEPLSATGIHTIEIDPQLAETARMTFTLSETVLR